MKRPEKRPEFEDVLVSCLSRIESEGDSGLDAMCGEYPGYADQLRQRVKILRDAGLIATTMGGEGFPEQLGDFRLIERLGHGGMGVVFLAEQISLGRRVALKVVRHEQLLDRTARARFAREVETVARLAHPGVVPVYAVGEEGGLPFFAMEYVRGASLERVVREVRGRGGPGRELGALTGRDLLATVESIGGVEAAAGASARAPFDGTWTAACLWIVREAAQALEHAHQRGVLHRDLKPSNIMVTVEGRVLLVDFGLASSAAAASITRTGAQLGSWHYMPPELVSRGIEGHDPRADVYSLGVTLYELLALRLPFSSEHLEQLHALILEGRPARLRGLVSGLARDVEAVVSVAMAPERERRYATAADLAGDLTRLLDMRPVEARARGPWLQLARWSQRHKGAAAAVALSVAVAVLGPLLFGWQQVRMGRRVEHQRANAELNLKVAIDAVEEIAVQLGDARLSDLPRVREVRRELLARADDLAAAIGEDVADKPTLVRAKIQARLGLARLDAILGEHEASEALLLEQVEAGTALLAHESANAEDRRMLALVHHQLALRRLDATDSAGALEHADRGLEVLGEGDDPPPTVAIHLLNSRAQSLKDQGRREESLRAVEAAIELGRRRSVAFPEESGTLGALADALNKFGTVVHMTDAKRGIAVLEEAWAIRLALHDAGPEDAHARLLLCRTGTNLGLLLDRDGRRAESMEIVLRSLEIAESLVEEFPAVPMYAGSVGSLSINLSGLYGEADRYEEGLELLDRALPLLRKGVELEPESASRSHWLAVGINQRSTALKELGRYSEAWAAQTEGLALQREVVAMLPSAEHRFHLGMALANRGSLAIVSDRYEEAAPSLREALPLMRGQGHPVYFIAAQWVRAARAVESDTSLGAAELDTRIQNYYGNALEILQLALEDGFVDRGGGLDKADWDPLRGDELFEQLRARAQP
jgi:serine/threonine protein kinase/tetratricopeptide (TPR) repeat protein